MFDMQYIPTQIQIAMHIHQFVGWLFFFSIQCNCWWKKKHKCSKCCNVPSKSKLGFTPKTNSMAGLPTKRD